MKVTYNFNQNESIIQTLVKNFPGFEKIESSAPNDFPVSIIFSDELPPVLVDKKDKNGKDNNEKLLNYPVETLLGKYKHETKEIIIYLLGIQYVVEAESEKMGYCKADFYQHLLKIVILHEIGHYWFYNFIDEANFKDDPNFKEDIRKFNETEQSNVTNTLLHEWIAQMFAYLCLDSEIEKTFMEKFADKQPEEYQTFLVDIQMNIDDFKGITNLLHLDEVFECISNFCFKDYLKVSPYRKYGYFSKISVVMQMLHGAVCNSYGNSSKYQQAIRNTNISNWNQILKQIISNAKICIDSNKYTL